MDGTVKPPDGTSGVDEVRASIFETGSEAGAALVRQRVKVGLAFHDDRPGSFCTATCRAEDVALFLRAWDWGYLYELGRQTYMAVRPEEDARGTDA